MAELQGLHMRQLPLHPLALHFGCAPKINDLSLSRMKTPSVQFKYNNNLELKLNYQRTITNLRFLFPKPEMAKAPITEADMEK